MKIVIVGCGRVGATLARILAVEGHHVTVIDEKKEAFRRLGERFPGDTVLGNGIDVDVLRRAGIEHADGFAATTNGDNRNVMAAQVASLIFKVPRVMARIYDPLRASVYHELGIETINPTTLGAGMIRDYFLGESWKPVEKYLELVERLEGRLGAEGY
jgi:trk system potassium uptake protein TrkA